MITTASFPSGPKTPSLTVRVPRLRINEFTLVAPDYRSPAPDLDATDPHTRILGLVWQRTDPTSVVEAAEATGVPVASAMVAITDLIEQERLLTCSPVATFGGPNALDQILESLQGRPHHVDMAKLVVVAPPGCETELRSFLGHAGPVHSSAHQGVGRHVLHALQRCTPTLALAMTGVCGLPPLQALWPDVTRNAAAIMLLVRDRDLADGNDIARWLQDQPTTPTLPLQVMVHLDAATEELDAPQVRRTLSIPAPVPVVMIDADDPRAVTTALRDVRRHPASEEGQA